MKIVHIAGSPRKKGNSMQIAERILTMAQEKGARILNYHLNSMSYKGCQGCYSCKGKTDRCVLKDDLTGLLDNLYDTDVFIVSSPVYFGEITGQLKTAFDRFFSFAKPDYITNPDPCRLPRGKKLVYIQTQGADQEQYKDLSEKYVTYFTLFGCDETHTIRACGAVNPADTKAMDAIMHKADEIAEKIMS
ncbi:MAG: flavodoxin family protein [Proteobacteria bacterium]|nr:flavodoxin family protein [Pseudomonadota bacterium]MBU1582424.1 flavodoxin family protein [Pseudomonadota bacterium]MBU2452498.1 flavodoxin family protein [Pseudomonadota bacterium]MBU2631254.1 flavodoxin family protein [Pseudomonadota bacterium]